MVVKREKKEKKTPQICDSVMLFLLSCGIDCAMYFLQRCSNSSVIIGTTNYLYRYLFDVPVYCIIHWVCNYITYTSVQSRLHWVKRPCGQSEGLSTLLTQLAPCLSVSPQGHLRKKWQKSTIIMTNIWIWSVILKWVFLMCCTQNQSYLSYLHLPLPGLDSFGKLM